MQGAAVEPRLVDEAVVDVGMGSVSRSDLNDGLLAEELQAPLGALPRGGVDLAVAIELDAVILAVGDGQHDLVALDWLVDQYRVKTDKRSGIVSDPNRLDDLQYIVRLIGQVTTVSVETVQIVEALPTLGLPEAS